MYAFMEIISGTLQVGELLLLGPNNFGEFYKVEVASIEVQRTPAKRIFAGQTGAILLKSLTNTKVSVMY